MNLEHESIATSYTPVEWVYREVAEEEMEKGTVGKVFYFCRKKGVVEAQGRLIAVEELDSKGVFLLLDSQQCVRLDQVITLFGKPGAAYEAYDAFANACMDCMGGYDLEDFDD